MNACLQASRSMPDVALGPHGGHAVALRWVGMQGLVVPLTLDADPARLRCGPGRVDAWVNLPADAARGIHMSRLYALTERVLSGEPLTSASLAELLRGFLDSHADFSTQARATLQFDLLVRRSALLSERTGWKSYPCRIDARLIDGKLALELECRIGYSSTCPASAALARQLIQQRFDADFGGHQLQPQAVREWLGSEQGICATPHGQRSEARVRVQLQAEAELAPEALIDAVESAVKTPLQTAVKRQDEQEFARLNGENLMFCEDAARRIHAALDSDPSYRDFAIRCSHFESLHPHDAVAVAVKGVPGGYAE